jgi:branched-chain amino acid transport system ATP-binding protein
MGLARMCELARVLAREPRLLLLDEPSSGLNDEETLTLVDLIRQLRQERELSVLVVEHDMSFVLTLCDEIYVLDFGKVIAHGTPDDVRNDPDIQAAYLGREA